MPVYSAVKTAYVLTALPAFTVFVGIGIASLLRWRRVHAWVLAILAVLFAVAAIHVVWFAATATI